MLAVDWPGIGEAIGGFAAGLTVLVIALRFVWLKLVWPAIERELKPNGGNTNTLGDRLQRIEEAATRADTNAGNVARQLQDHIVVDERMHAQFLRHLAESGVTP